MAVMELPLTPKSCNVDTPKPDLKGRRNQGYKRIRWREYDPSKKVATLDPDQFVQWKPPSLTTDKALEVNEKKRSARSMMIRPSDQSTVARLSVPTSPPPSPLQPLPSNGTRDDPFTILPIKKTDCVVQTMDYFVTICQGIKLEDSVVCSTQNPHLSLLLPFAIQHSILFESMIAVCRASVLLSLGRPPFEDQPFIHHRGSALAGLNSRLTSENCTDDAAILTVLMLMTLEYLTGNHYGVTMHCNGLERMLQLRDHMPEDSYSAVNSEWGRFVKAGLIGYKALASFVTGQAPSIPTNSMGYASETFEALNLNNPLSYPEKPFSEGLCIVLSRFPAGLSELSLMSRVSEQMINTIASVSGAITQLTTLPSTPAKEVQSLFFTPATELSDDEHARRQMMIQNLLSALQRLGLMSPTTLEIYLSFGLMSFVFQLRRLTSLNLFYDPILRQFITSLPHHSKPTSIEEQNALIWVSISVGGSLALRSVPLPEAHTVLDHALELYPEARNWPRLEKIVRTFFWTDEIGAHWKGVWKKAMKRREKLLQRRPTFNDVVKLDVPHPSADWIRNHIKGAPREMHQMGAALGICPFRPRQSSSKSD